MKEIAGSREPAKMIWGAREIDLGSGGKDNSGSREHGANFEGSGEQGTPHTEPHL